MKERPIIFSGPMVRAILEGRKTQTRRVVKDDTMLAWLNCDNVVKPINDHVAHLGCPYGQPGDRLWVRETFCPDYDPPIYKADEDQAKIAWKPSIHMPRWASRITLEITAVRVERLQDISDADALAEGCEPFRENDMNAIDAYADLWADINGPENWEANPWVWVIEFKKVGE